MSRKIAIYSGEIPSTTFIERLIIGLAISGTTIYLFGNQKKKINYPKNVHLFTFSKQWDKIFVLLRYSILLFLFKPKEKKQLDSIIAFQKGSQKLKKIKYYPVLYHQPDIFHLQWAKGIEDWLWVQEFDIKLVLSLRGAHINYTPITTPKFKEIYNSCFPKVDGFHAVSNAILNESLIYQSVESKIKIIYSGFDLVKLDYSSKKQLNSKISIVSIGRSHWKKGYNYALDALAILEQQNIEFQYTIVGINNEEELIFQQNQLNLVDKVSFLNKLPFKEILKLIKEADVLLLPSVEEGIANVVLEAMALGTLVVSTDCGGMQEVVQDGENGFVVPVRNAKALAESLLKASKLTLLEYNEMTKKGRAVIEQQHSNEKMIHDFTSFYESILTKEVVL